MSVTMNRAQNLSGQVGHPKGLVGGLATYLIAMLVVPGIGVAQPTSLSDLTSQASKIKCLRAYANPALGPLRGKMPMDIDAEPSGEMLLNKSVPTANERMALPAYLIAERYCARLFLADISNKPLDTQAPTKNIAPDEEFELLQTGKISYAEYFQLAHLRIQGLIGKLPNNPTSASHAYEGYIDGWLTPSKSQYPEGSPWWDFYNYSITTAREVDSGKIAQNEGQRLIEAHRLKFNDELAAQTKTIASATLNCSITDSQNANRDTPVTLDYSRKLANNYHAEFSDTWITWTSTAADGVEYHNALNRLSGSLSVGTSQYPALLAGHCAPAKQQF